VLIYADGTACLADFGLSVMLASISPTSYNSTVKGTLRWMAPELLEQREDGSPGRPSKQSDIYSFGGLMLQVCLKNFDHLDEIVNSAFRSSAIKFPTITSQT